MDKRSNPAQYGRDCRYMHLNEEPVMQNLQTLALSQNAYKSESWVEKKSGYIINTFEF